MKTLVFSLPLILILLLNQGCRKHCMACDPPATTANNNIGGGNGNTGNGNCTNPSQYGCVGDVLFAKVTGSQGNNMSVPVALYDQGNNYLGLQSAFVSDQTTWANIKNVCNQGYTAKVYVKIFSVETMGSAVGTAHLEIISYIGYEE